MTPDRKPTEHESKEATLTEFVAYFLRLGAIGFGGPIALAGHMQQDLVDDRKWIPNEDYLEGLALAQLAPGPLAAQLAIYLGYIHSGVLGATAVGIAFVLPSFLMVLALSAAYVRFGGLPWMQGMFYGIGAAVIGIIARSAYKLTKLTLRKDKLLWGMFIVLAATTACTKRPDNTCEMPARQAPVPTLDRTDWLGSRSSALPPRCSRSSGKKLPVVATKAGC